MPVGFIQKQLVPVPLGQGIDTKTDPKQLQPGKLLTLQNGQFSKGGQLNKRFGYDLLNNTIEGGGTITNGVELANYKNELILFDGTYLYTYLPATGNWSNRGVAISVTTEDKDIIRRQDAAQQNPDMAYLSGIEVFAWEDSRGGVWYSVLDSTTRAFIVSDTQIGAQVSAGVTTYIVAQQPKCIAFQNNIFIFYADTSQNLWYQKVNPLNPTQIAAPVQLCGGVASGALSAVFYSPMSSYPYDVAVIGNRMFIAYLAFSPSGLTAFTPTISFFYLDIGFRQSPTNYAISLSNTTTISATTGCINVVGDSALNIWISYGIGKTITVSAFSNATLGSIFSPALVATVGQSVQNQVIRTVAAIESYTSQEILVFYETFSSNSYQEFTSYNTVTTTGRVGPTGLLLSVGLASKPFKYNGNIFINTAYTSQLQSTDFTFFIPPSTTTGGTNPTNASVSTNPYIIAKETYQVGGGYQTNAMVPETPMLTTGQFIFANLQAGKIVTEAATQFSVLGVNSTKLSFSPTNNFVNTTQANTLLIVGGVLQSYDGTFTTECGFHIYPEAQSITATPQGGGGNLSAGTYQYIVEYQWTDNNGLIYKSAPSTPISVTTVASDSVNIVGANLHLTNKQIVSIAIYRTTVGSTGPFYRVTNVVNPPTINPAVTTLPNDFWTAPLDILADTVITSNEQDYTTGNVLENMAPPANSIVAQYNDRVFLAGMSDKLEMWYSQTVFDNSAFNTIPPEFSQFLTMSCDSRGGDITALGLLNQALIIFKHDKIFSVQGNGPDATGANSDYGDPQLITSDVGCINANSVAIVPMGLMFQTAKGIYLLDQNLNTSYLGAPVEAYNSLNITSAITNPQDNQVIFTSSNGTALVYDYYYEQWSTWTNHFAADGAIYNNLFCFLTTGGQVFVQNRSKFSDNTSPVYLNWTTANLAFAGLQGYQRIFKFYILGTFKSPHTLQVQVAFDYNDTYVQTATITPINSTSHWGSDQSWGDGQFWGGAYQVYEYRIDTQIQKCTAIRISVSESQTSVVPQGESYGEGYSISSIVFEVGILPGGNRLPQTQIYGAK